MTDRIVASCESPANQPAWTIAFVIPVIKPDATSAGINGMKILAIFFKNSLNGVAFFLLISAFLLAAASFKLKPPEASTNLQILLSPYLLFQVPVSFAVYLLRQIQ